MRLAGPLLLLALACGGSDDMAPKPDTAREVPAVPPSPAHGTLRATLHGAGGGARAPLHRHVYRKGDAYRAMADVDLRGFLDGRFQYGWNQPDQVHVRLGRRKSSPRYGETELFRVVQRWDALGIPRDAEIESAALWITVERGIRRRARVLLYALESDFDPGHGGSEQNNTGTPEPGDVWWGERAHGEADWGLPGAGFASETDPLADTPKTALADASYRPDLSKLRFDSEALRAEVETRVRAGRPLGFLLKLADVDEDEPDTLIHLYSAEEGDSANPARRPRLEIAWRAPARRVAIDRELELEPGRSAILPAIETSGAKTLAVSFDPAPDSGDLTLEWRRVGASESAWQRLRTPLALEDAAAVELRAIAARHPVALGRAFETTLRDTWIRTAPPEEQQLRFFLVAPSGERFDELARYTGDYRFELSFVPGELGRWRYWYEHAFELPYRGAGGVFDVVATERAGVVAALEALEAELVREGLSRGERGLPERAPRFWQLERALLALETPQSFESPAGRTRFAKLTRLREVLSEREVPDQASLKPLERDY